MRLLRLAGSSVEGRNRLNLAARSVLAIGMLAALSVVTMPSTAVAQDAAAGHRYDADGNGEIDKSELIAAINDYLFKGTLAKPALIQIINIYLGFETLEPTPTLGPDVRGSYGPGHTGLNVKGLEMFDELVAGFMAKWSIPGGAIAVAKDGRLVLAKGYGLADEGTNRPVLPDTLFRIASISKPVTAVAVLKLVEAGELDLDERVFQILDGIESPAGKSPDPRLGDVTVRHLLQHSGGWDQDLSFDPMWRPASIERELGVPRPVSCRDAIVFMLGRPLDFGPGGRYAYSNFGYCLFGRIIEEKTGISYEHRVQQSVLEPIGATRMKIGGTLPEDRAEGEATYYGFPGQRNTRSALPGTADSVPWPYGGFHLGMMDAHGGWVASAIDLVRFATAVDGSRDPRLLAPETVSLMVEHPGPPLWRDSSYHYGLGWLVRPFGDDANWWHDGSLPGTTALLVRSHHGAAWAALFNSRPDDWRRFGAELDDLMWDGVRAVKSWPAHDLFPRFGYE